MIPFDFHSQQVRVLSDGRGEPLFVARDVAKVLGYVDTAQAIATNCKKAKSLKDMDQYAVLVYKNQQLTELDPKTKLIPESDLYRLVMRSRLESAEQFQDWVVEEVLPRIRKTGAYSMDNPSLSAHPMQIARIIVSEYLEISKLFEVPQHYAQIEAVKEAHSGAGVDLSPLLLRAPAQDRIEDHELMLEPTELGKHYGVSAVKMNQRLAEAGLQVKTEAGWEATDAGKHISVRHAWKNKMKSGYNYKWKVSAVKSIIPVDD